MPHSSGNAHAPRLCLVSSSGGHWEQLRKLQPLVDKYEGFYVTEQTPFAGEGSAAEQSAEQGTRECPYLMIQTDLKDWLMPAKMLMNSARAIRIWVRERPDVVITTGTMVAYPFYLLSVLTRGRFVFVETFGRSQQPTVAGKMMHKHAGLFLVQWPSQLKFYPKARYVGCLY